MYQVIIVVHVLLGLGIIGLIMIQQGKGADAGASFGTGASGTVFGSQGAGSFLTRTTAIFATLFFTTSLGLAVLNGKQGGSQDIMSEPAQETAPTPAIPNASNKMPEANIPNVPEVKTELPGQSQADIPAIEEKSDSPSPSKTEQTPNIKSAVTKEAAKNKK